jgi:hypothetical protein
MEKQLRMICAEEQAEIERMMLDRSCSRDEAVRRLAAPEKKSAPKAEPRPVRWIGNEDD